MCSSPDKVEIRMQRQSTENTFQMSLTIITYKSIPKATTYENGVLKVNAPQRSSETRTLSTAGDLFPALDLTS